MYQPDEFDEAPTIEDALAHRGLNRHPQSKEFKEAVIDSQYRHLAIDTVQRSKANHTLEQQKAICQFMIDKYINREKGQDRDDVSKARYYLDWLEEIVMRNQ